MRLLQPTWGCKNLYNGSGTLSIIVQISTLKLGGTCPPAPPRMSGRELWYLHDVLSRHLRALMTWDPYRPFVTALIQLKVDQPTNFEWQRYSQSKPGVSHFDKLLKFLDQRALAAESSTRECTKSTFKSKVLHVSNMASTHFWQLAEAIVYSRWEVGTVSHHKFVTLHHMHMEQGVFDSPRLYELYNMLCAREYQNTQAVPI